MKRRNQIFSILTLAACCWPALLAAQTPAAAGERAPVLTASSAADAPAAYSSWRGVTVTKRTFAVAPQFGAAGATGGYLPRYELFLGYSNLRGISQGAPGNRLAWLSGASTSLAINVNRTVGIVFDFAGYSDTRFGPNAPPAGGVVPANGSVYTLMVGPRFSWRHDRWTPFVQALFGEAWASRVSLANCTGVGCYPLPSESSYALTAGGGLDLNLWRHFALRLFQVEYAMSRFRNPDSASNPVATQNDARLSTGVVFRFGGDQPAAAALPSAQLTEACTAEPASVLAGSGATVDISAAASGFSPFPLTYGWASTGGAISGSGPHVQWSSAGVAPGTYAISGRVDNRHGGTADCSVAITVAPRAPITLSCSADPATLVSGVTTQLTALGNSPDSNSLTYSWQADQGSISGTGSTASFDSTGLAAGEYTVNAQVQDDRGATAKCSVNLAVEAAAALPQAKALEAVLSLHSIYFPTNQPDTADPDAGISASQQTVLRTLAANFKKYLQLKPEAHITLEGHADERGSEAFNVALAERRVALAKSFLVSQGVPAGKIETRSLGEHEELDAAQVRRQMEQNPNLTDAQRQQLFTNLPSVILAQNRRVDIILSGTGQKSLRRYPFNASDALSLLSDTALQR